MPLKTLHLICNAHLDPVWLWEWEEGAAEALSTFRVAANFCEEFSGFIFNHNEVTLYKWVEEYEPALFARIQKLVKEGKWHIMGGWYLQPDCNMPSGESFVRQMLIGRNYFWDKFGVAPTTAINFDPFGHSRGLVQIMKKAGFDSYLFCRPGANDCPLPAEDFIWVGYDGSEIIGHRSLEHYLSALGKADQKVNKFIEKNSAREVSTVLWGVGNHGGGPSKIDLENLKKLIEGNEKINILHSTPEAYFQQLKNSGIELPRHEKDLNSWAPGCYTSQIRIKQKHRLLENELYMVEKMMSHAAILGLTNYPHAEIHESACDLMVTEFHDILPGSSIQNVEETSLRLIDHGLEILSRLKARAFFALATGQKKANENEIPILVYNPHPYPVWGNFECEFQLADQNWKEEFTLPKVFQNGIEIPSQPEKELSNLNLDWRKRVVFHAKLEPAQMNRFDVKLEIIPAKPTPNLIPENGILKFRSAEIELDINCQTGFVDRYFKNGIEFLKQNSFVPLVLEDNDDPWGMETHDFRKVAGVFTLMTPEEGTRFSGIQGKVLPSVRVIEDGDVRTVIEALFRYGDSFLIQTYKIPKQGSEIEVQIRVHWNEKSKMLKLSVPTNIQEGVYLGQVAYGRDELAKGGKEVVAQKWNAVQDIAGNRVFTCINDGIYGSDYADGEMRLSLLRSSGFSGHPINNRPIMAQDRYSSRIDQGERLYRLWFNAGQNFPRMEAVEREALSLNEKPFVLSFFPSGEGELHKNSLMVDTKSVLVTTFKKAERTDDYIIRLFEPTGVSINTNLSLPALGININVKLNPFEIKTLKLNLKSKKFSIIDLMENFKGLDLS